MISISLSLLVAAAPAFQVRHKPPTPGPKDISVRRAQAIAQAFADKGGFKVKVDSLPFQFVVTDPSSKNGYPVEDERRWYLGGPEIHFTVGARSGRVTAFRRGNRTDESRRLDAFGPHMSSRNALVEHASKIARRLGVPNPAKIHAGGVWDNGGRPKIAGVCDVVLFGKRRQVQMNFHPKDGDLMFYSDHADAPGIGPRDALSPRRGEISPKAAVQSVSKFRQALKLAPIQYEDSFATLQTFMPIGDQRSWRVEHPTGLAEVDPKNGKVQRMSMSREGSFKKGERPFVSSKSQAERHLRNIVGRVGVPTSAAADVRVVNEEVFHYGWIGQIQGTFTWKNNICNVVCDLQKGELLRIDFLKPRPPINRVHPPN